jgi:thiol-disulfide isomerase/thioredoxin
MSVPVEEGAGQAPPTYTCPAWQREPDGTVAGRSVYHVTCDSLGFWIDTETLILLRHDDPEPPELEVIGFEPGVSAPAEAFALVKPPGAFDPADRPPSTVLVVGQAAPTLSGPLLGGGTFTSASLLGKPSLVVFWATWCPPCAETVEAVETVVEPRRGEVNAVTIATQDKPAALRDYLAAHPVSAPIVLDDDGSRLSAWGFLGIPSFVLLDAEGRVSAVHVGAITPADLDAMVDAALAGRPIPPPTAAP